MTKGESLECVRVTSEHAEALFELLQALHKNGDDRYFHPHPFTQQAVEVICNYTGDHLYYLLMEGGRAAGYAMLRCWDEGYDIPSLGIAIHPDFRGNKLATAFMNFLHAAARRKGAEKIRLKVYPDNVPAIKMYERLGYEFSDVELGQLVGSVTL